jgi:hypothetical protein
MMAACRPRGHFYFDVPQWGQRYTLVLEVDLAAHDSNPYAWDDKQTLSNAIALSRLVRDNAHCAEFAGRIVDHEDGEQQIIPLYAFESRLAYRYGRERDWLDEAEADALTTLLDRFLDIEPDRPPRVRRAIRNCERASQTPFLLESQPRLVTAFEALLNTHPTHVSKQFRDRVRTVAAEVGAGAVSGRMLDRMYDLRSKAYHGDDVHLYSGDPGASPRVAERDRQIVEEAKSLQTVLRATVRRALEDEAFRAVFEEDERIVQRWPVTVCIDGHLQQI